MSGTALRARAKELSAKGAGTPERAVAFREAVVRRAAGSGPLGGVYAQMAADVRRVAKAGGLDPEEELATVLADAELVGRLSLYDDVFWGDVLKGRALELLCGREPGAVCAGLLRVRPRHSEELNRLWRQLMERSGTLARLSGELPGVPESGIPAGSPTPRPTPTTRGCPSSPGTRATRRRGTGASSGRRRWPTTGACIAAGPSGQTPRRPSWWARTRRGAPCSNTRPRATSPRTGHCPRAEPHRSTPGFCGPRARPPGTPASPNSAANTGRCPPGRNSPRVSPSSWASHPPATVLLAAQVDCAPHQLHEPNPNLPSYGWAEVTWKLRRAEREAVAEGLTALLTADDLAGLYEQLLPDDPERLWTDGPDIERAAAWWRTRHGTPLPVPADLLPLAGKEFTRPKGEHAVAAASLKGPDALWWPTLRTAALLGRVTSGTAALSEGNNPADADTSPPSPPRGAGNRAAGPHRPAAELPADHTPASPPSPAPLTCSASSGPPSGWPTGRPRGIRDGPLSGLPSGGCGRRSRPGPGRSPCSPCRATT
ncbi:hypothetical protein ACFYWX_28425 [Streptomyces sp. NPDC002888]|uniref:hypothetical protein n=1 Tax=Streptomyces sp. NPDC002888 TaxID=3364668 RepID=UPI003684B690